MVAFIFVWVIIVPTGAPEGVTAEITGSKAVRVIWEPPAKGNKGAVQSYRIRWEPTLYDEGNFGETIQQADKARSYNIEMLNTWTEYKITIAAGNIKGFGPESAPVIIRTGEDGT